MNRSHFVILAAFALGALAWSCADQASSPTTPLDLDQPAFHHAPDHAKGGGGDDGGGGGGKGGGGGDDGGSTTVALADAMTTLDPPAHAVKGKENKRSISYSTDQNAVVNATAEMNFAHAAASTKCWTEPAEIDRAELVAQLTATVTDAKLSVEFDKSADGAVSDNHGVVVVGGGFRIGLPPHREPIGTMVSDDGTTAVMEFTGGDVRVWRISDDAKLFCPNDPPTGDAVTVTLTR